MKALCPIAVFAGGVIGLGYWGWHDHAANMETQISDAVFNVFPNGTRHKADIAVIGRDIEVSGTFHTKSEQDSVIDALTAIDGRRVVRVGEIEILPVAQPYQANIQLSNAELKGQLNLPDAAIEQDLGANWPALQNMDIDRASGMPNAAWPDVVKTGAGAIATLEGGTLAVSDTTLALSGKVASLAGLQTIEALPGQIPEGYRLDISGVEMPKAFDLTLTADAGKTPELSGSAPYGTDIAAFSENLDLGEINADTVTIDATGDLGKYTAITERFAAISDNFSAYELTLPGADGAAPVLAGKVKANADFDQVRTALAKTGIDSEGVFFPQPFDLSVAYDAQKGVTVEGLAPEGLDLDGIKDALNLASIDSTNFETGGTGDAEALRGQIGAIGDVLPLMELAMIDLSRQDTPEFSGETLPQVSIEEVTAKLSENFADIAVPNLAKTTRTYADGATRINPISGLEERYFGGFWIPVLKVFEASTSACEARSAEIFTESKIEFASGGAELSTSSRLVVNKIASLMGVCFDGTAIRANLKGHTDSQGDEVANYRLSLDRVNSVRSALVDRGIQGNRLTAVGYGETEPIASNDTAEGRAKNRRTEIEWIDAE